MTKRLGTSELSAYIPPLAAGLWLVWTSMAEPFPELGIWNGKRLSQLWLFPLLMVSPLLHRATREGVVLALRELGIPLMAGWLCFLALGVLSSLRLDHPSYPLADVALLYLLALGALAVAASRYALNERFDRMVLGLLALMGFGVYCLEGIAVSAYLSSNSQYAYMESLLRFGHPRMYNQVQTWTLPVLALLPAVFPERPWLRWLTPVLIGMQWQIILVTAARGSIISLFVAMAVMALLVAGSRKSWLRHQLFGLLVGLILYGALVGFLRIAQPEMEQFVAQSAGRQLTSSSGRVYLWELAIQDATANPLLGAGPAMYACDSPFSIAGSPHSFPLQILGEWGVPAFLLLGAVFTALLIRLLGRSRPHFRAQPSRVSLVRTCLAISILAACIHALVSGIPIAPASQVAGMLILGWCWGLPGAVVPPDNKRGRLTRTGPALLLSGLVISGSLLVFAQAELMVMELRTAYAEEYGVSAPRFWRDGRVCLYNYEGGD